MMGKKWQRGEWAGQTKQTGRVRGRGIENKEKKRRRR